MPDVSYQVAKSLFKQREYNASHLAYEKELARHVNLNATYLCDLFKKETGITLNKYIKSCKIEASKNMLQYSDYSPGDIAQYLGFSSHSHFISVFKAETGMTPKQFRDLNYRTHFSHQ